MNNYFDEAVIHEYYPEAEDLMFPSMNIWKLPKGKEDKLSEVCGNGNYFLTEKIDGAFYQFVKTENHSYLFGRTVSKITGLLTEKGDNVPHLKEAFAALPARTILIGEVYIPGGTSKNTVSVMGCLPTLAIKKQEGKPVHYYVHDIIFYDGESLLETGAEARYDILKEVWEKYELDRFDFLRLAVKVEENLEEEISSILKSGGEGVVLKKKDHPYTPDKRPAWSTVKIKQMDFADLVCMGFCNATREYTGKELETWSYWARALPVSEDYELCEGQLYGNDEGWIPVTKPYFLGWYTAIRVGAYNDKGELVELGTVSSGLTDEDKKNMTECPKEYLNKVVSLDCMSRDNVEHTLRHPVFKGWRIDKNPKDCLISEIFQ